MGKFRKNVKMMDAGTALFTKEEKYGFALGQVKAEMEEFGKVYRSISLSPEDFPTSTAECDLFLDFSTLWRIRYISCLVQDSGTVTTDIGQTHRYSAVFKEGNMSTRFRGIVHIFVLLLSAALMFVTSEVLIHLLLIALIITTIAIWISPSKTSTKTLNRIVSKIRNL